MNSTKPKQDEPKSEEQIRETIDRFIEELSKPELEQLPPTSTQSQPRLTKDLLHYATKRIRILYTKSNSINDLHAKLGQLLSQPPEVSIELYKIDDSLNRLSFSGMRELELLLARSDRMAEASEIIKKHYELDPKATDRYARTADACFTPKKQFEKLQQYIELDKAEGRTSWFGVSMEARQSAIEGDLQTSIGKLKNLHQCGKGRAGLFEKVARSLMWLWMFDRADTLLKSEQSPSTHFDHIATLCSQIKATVAQSIQAYPEEIRPTLASQLQQIPYAETHAEILNSKVFFASRYDLIHLFHEIVLFQPYFFSSAKKEPYIIDAGANCGVALAYFKYLYPNARIEAIEPQPHLTSLLKRTIKQNSWNNVSLHQCALSSKESHSVTLKTQPGNEMGATTLSSPKSSTAFSGSIQVAAKTLSPFLTKEVDFLKLDIEGAEAEVLVSVGPKIQHVNRGFIEYHYNSHSSKNNLSTVLEALESNGFAYSIEEPFRRVPTPASPGQKNKIAPRWSLSIYFQKA